MTVALWLFAYACSVLFSYGALNVDTCNFLDKLNVKYSKSVSAAYTRRKYCSLMLFDGLISILPVINIASALCWSSFMRHGWSLTRRPRILTEDKN